MYEPSGIHLANWGKDRDMSLRCPGCGRLKVFKEFVYADGSPVDPIDHSCGICERKNNCGYELHPSEFFKANPNAATTLHRGPKLEEKPKQMLEIGKEYVKAQKKLLKTVNNNFNIWLHSLPLTDEQAAMRDMMLDLYQVGTLTDGRTVFWQIDEQFRVRTGKVIQYQRNGKRLKDADGNSIGFNFMHKLLEKRGLYNPETQQFQQCLFGLHLVSTFPEADIHLVESEKSAIVCSIFSDPRQKLWLATGSLQNFKLEWLLPLMMKGKLIAVYPDHDGFDEWQKKTDKILEDYNRTAVRKYNGMAVSRFVENNFDHATDSPKADIADIILRRLMNGRQSQINAMVEKNPAVGTLINKFDLK